MPGWLVIPGNPPTMQPNILSAVNNAMCTLGNACTTYAWTCTDNTGILCVCMFMCVCDLRIKTWWTSVGKEPLAFSTSGPLQDLVWQRCWQQCQRSWQKLFPLMLCLFRFQHSHLRIYPKKAKGTVSLPHQALWLFVVCRFCLWNIITLYFYI